MTASLSTEMMFSLYQTAKLLNFENIKNSNNIYKTHKSSKTQKTQITFRQQTYAFEYHYLKAKLLINYNSFLDYINNIHIYDEKDNNNNKDLLNLKFPRQSKGDVFTNFGRQLLMKNPDFDKALNIIMKTKPTDINLRMTKIEIPL